MPRRSTISGQFGIYLGLPCGVVVQDPSGSIVEANQAAVSMLGLSRQRLIGLSFGDPCWRASDLSGERIQLSVERLRNLRLRLVQPNGSVTWLQVRSQFLSSPRGRLEAVISCLMDITPIMNAQALVTRLSGLTKARGGDEPPPSWWEEMGRQASSDKANGMREEDRD